MATVKRPRFSSDFIKGVRAKMESRRKELLQMERDMEKEGLNELSEETTDEISHVRLHPADLGTTEFDQDMDLSLAESEIREIQDIEDALTRLQQNEYGICQECGVEIPFSRLEALPYTRYCAACEVELEQRHRRELEARESRNPTL